MKDQLLNRLFFAPKKYLFVALFLCSFSAWSQDSITPATAFPFSRHFVSLSLYNGANVTRFTSVHGDQSPESSTGLVHALKFQYSFYFNPSNAISVKVGGGIFPFTYRVQPYQEFEGTSGWGYFERSTFEGFALAEATYIHRQPFGTRQHLLVFAGGGSLFTQQMHSGTSLSSANQMVDYEFDVDYTNKPKPYLTAGAGITKAFERSGTLGFSIGFQYSLAPVFSGYYSLYNEQAAGSLRNKGHQFFVTLDYHFTRQKRSAYLKARKPLQDKKQAKKEWRKQARYIDPKSYFASISLGPSFVPNRVDAGAAPYFDDVTTTGFALQAALEKGLGKNYYLDLGIGWQKFNHGTHEKNSFFTSSGEAFNSLQLSAGITKRLTNANHFNFINLQAGLSLMYITDSKGLGGSSGSYAGTTLQDSLAIYTAQQYVLHKFMPGVYLGISKDFRLGNGLFLSLTYRYTQGFAPVFEQRMVHDPNNLSGTYATGRITINGSSQVVLLGLKFNW